MSIPTQQKALFLQSKQGEFAVGTADVPKPGPGEILVRVEAAGLNPVDWKIQAYGIFITKYPAVLGADSAGVVAAVGEGVTRLTVGDKVFHQGTRNGLFSTFQQYTTVPAEIAGKIPSNITFDEAASVPVTSAAAALGLYNKKAAGGAEYVAPWLEGGRGKYAGQPIVILGGSSSVGQYAVQFARLSGFSPIITTVSPRNNDFVKSLGATHVIDRHLSSSAIQGEVKKITSEPIRLVYDAISTTETQDTGYDILTSGGKLIIVVNPLVDEKKITSEKDIIGASSALSPPHNRSIGGSLFSKLTEWLSSGEIKPNPVEVIPGGLAGVAKGLDRLKNDQVSGHKLVVHPQETA